MNKDGHHLLEVIIKCQSLLAEYLPPDSDITDEQIIRALLGILDDRDLVVLVDKLQEKQDEVS